MANIVTNKELEELLTRAEELDWSCTIFHEPERKSGYFRYNERNYVELSKYSPAEEDFSMTIDFNEENPAQTFLENLEAYAYDFDPEDHVGMYIATRGENGVSESIWDLLDDADAIKDMILELFYKLTEAEGKDVTKKCNQVNATSLVNTLLENFLAALPHEKGEGNPFDPNFGYNGVWTDGDEILCVAEDECEEIANSLTCLFKLMGSTITINTGYYPLEDAEEYNSSRAGFNYITFI